MKFFTLLFVAALSATILTGCERQSTSPIEPTDPSQTTAQLAQRALSELAGTAAELSFDELANAASEVAEVLAIDDGTTSVQPTFSKLAELADKAIAFHLAFVDSGCEIGTQKFAEASLDAVKAYTIRDTAEMEQALQNLAEGAMTAEIALQQLPAHKSFIPFAFGYGHGIDSFNPYYTLPYVDYSNVISRYAVSSYHYVLGAIQLQYDEGTLHEDPREAVAEFLYSKGYDGEGGLWGDQGEEYPADVHYVGAPVDPLLLGAELTNIPGVVRADPVYPILGPSGAIPDPPSYYMEIIRRVAEKYNQAWCQGNFGVIDSILIEESGLDFFDYAFVRNLADIYAEEIPETAERIRTNRFSLRSIAIKFLEIYSSEIYSQDSKRTHDEIIDQFRQSVSYETLGIELRTSAHYYRGTDYWKQLVTDHLNK